MSTRAVIIITFSILASIIGVELVHVTLDAWNARRLASAHFEAEQTGRIFVPNKPVHEDHLPAKVCDHFCDQTCDLNHSKRSDNGTLFD